MFPPAETSFNTLPPSGTYSLSELAKHPIPPAKYLRSLKEHVENLPNDTRLTFELGRSVLSTGVRMLEFVEKRGWKTVEEEDVDTDEQRWVGRQKR